MGDREVITSKSGSYEVIRKLGEGYTGEVYLVKDLGRNEPVAMKFLNPQAFKEGQLEAFKREFMLLSDLHHPHVCRVFDFGFAESKDRYFFTQEVVQGTDLYTYTEQLSIEEIEEIFVQIADGLGIIHSAGLIHFDIKGDNILITMAGDKPIAKIVDFGLAAPSFEKPENIAGTVRYISPEMITKKQSIDYRADLYSLGIVLYRMLMGRYPEQGSNMKEVLAWHTQHVTVGTKALEEKGIPQYLIDVVEKLTQRIPTDRFSSAAVVIRYIELHSGKTYSKTQKKLVATLMEEGPLVARDDLIFEVRSIFNRLGRKEILKEDEYQTLVLTGPHGSGKSRVIKEARYISQLAELDSYMVRGEVEGQDVDGFRKALGCVGVEVSTLTEEIFKKQPLAIMVDNLDRCCRQVKEFVAGFANSLYSSRFMGEPRQIYLIVTMTAEGEKDSLPVPLHLDVEHEHLSPFTAEDVTQYIRLSLGESNPPVKQVQDILKFSGGIPELVRAAIASLDSPTARLAGDADQIFTDRMQKLDPAAKRVLGFIALAERPLALQQLIVLTGLMIETALTELTKGGFLTYDRDTEVYQIATGAIANAVQKFLPEEDKKEIASKLLKYFEEEGLQDIDSMVRYASMGAGPDEVTGYLVKAAEIKEGKSELDDAYSYYGKLIDLLDEKDERLPSIHRKLARQQLLKGEYDEALGHIDAAAGITGVSIGDLTSRSWIDRLRHRPQEALKHIEEALKKLKEDYGSTDYLKLLNEKAQCFVQMGNADEAIRIFKETDGHTARLSNEDKKKVANNNLGLALAQKGDFDTAIKFYKEKLGFFSEEKQIAASVLSQFGYVYQQAGLLTEALEVFKKSWAIYSDIGDTHSSVAILGNLVSICQSKALFTDALEYVKESIQLASRAGSERELAGNFLTLGTLYITLGLEDVARRYLNEAATIFQKLEDPHMEAWVQISFAYLYKNLRRYKEAVAYLDNVIKKGKDASHDDLILWGSHGAAEMLLDLGEVEKAEKYLNNIEMEWKGADGATEVGIKVELLRLKSGLARQGRPPKEIETRLNELAEISARLELREMVGEVYHALAEYYEKAGDQMASARFVAKAKEIIDDIVGTLSEEYRDTFLKQQFRQKVFEDSIRLKDLISQVDIEVPEEVLRGAGLVDKGSVKGPEPEAAPAPAGGGAVVQETAVFTGAYRAEGGLQIIGQSGQIVKLRETIDQIKDSPANVLVTGEDGTGKELVAHMIRDAGRFRERPWRKVDPSTLPEGYLEKALWGEGEESVFEAAADGVLFIANIDRMSGDLQKGLLKVLEQKKFARSKDGMGLPFRARIIASTTFEGKMLVKEAGFNKSLAKKISEVVLHIPPLRERKVDIPLLIDHYLEKIAGEYKVESYSVVPAALKMIMKYNWPGNLRDLEQILRSVCVMVKDGKITEEQLSVYINSL